MHRMKTMLKQRNKSLSFSEGVLALWMFTDIWSVGDYLSDNGSVFK